MGKTYSYARVIVSSFIVLLFSSNNTYSTHYAIVFNTALDVNVSGRQALHTENHSEKTADKTTKYTQTRANYIRIQPKSHKENDFINCNELKSNRFKV